MDNYQDFLKERFLAYTAISSQSNEKVSALPSSAGQKAVLAQVEKDLQALGVSDLALIEGHTLIARIKGNSPAPALGFAAHVDTVDIGASPEVKAQLLKYEGKDIVLNPERNIVFRAGEHPEADPYRGQEIFFTDGTSVLGADDKAGVSVLTALAAYLQKENPLHGDVYLAYLPDEEIGLKGAYALDLARYPVELSYTIDGGAVGTLGSATFNGASLEVFFEGVSIHPGSAKGVMINPILLAQHFLSQLDPMDTPEHSEEEEGFFWVHELNANPMGAFLKMIIRDFDAEGFARRKAYVLNALKRTQEAYPKAKIGHSLKEDYSNIASAMGGDTRCLQLARAAYGRAGISVHEEAVRGGTDGSVLSAKGLPTPNIFTGGINAHSVFEFLPLPSLVLSFEVCTHIITGAPSCLKK